MLCDDFDVNNNNNNLIHYQIIFLKKVQFKAL